MGFCRIRLDSPGFCRIHSYVRTRAELHSDGGRGGEAYGTHMGRILIAGYGGSKSGFGVIGVAKTGPQEAAEEEEKEQ